MLGDVVTFSNLVYLDVARTSSERQTSASSLQDADWMMNLSQLPKLKYLDVSFRLVSIEDVGRFDPPHHRMSFFGLLSTQACMKRSEINSDAVSLCTLNILQVCTCTGVVWSLGNRLPYGRVNIRNIVDWCIYVGVRIDRVSLKNEGEREEQRKREREKEREGERNRKRGRGRRRGREGVTHCSVFAGMQFLVTRSEVTDGYTILYFAPWLHNPIPYDVNLFFPILYLLVNSPVWMVGHVTFRRPGALKHTNTWPVCKNHYTLTVTRYLVGLSTSFQWHFWFDQVIVFDIILFTLSRLLSLTDPGPSPFPVYPSMTGVLCCWWRNLRVIITRLTCITRHYESSIVYGYVKSKCPVCH